MSSEKKKIGFCQLILSCCTTKKSAAEQPPLSDRRRITRQIRASDQVAAISSSGSESSNSHRPNQIQVEPRIEEVVPPFQSNIIITSVVAAEQLQFASSIPKEDREGRHNLKYYCPICLRYFNSILESKCCKNYICRFCANDLVEQEAKVCKPAGCLFGCSTANPD